MPLEILYPETTLSKLKPEYSRRVIDLKEWRSAKGETWEACLNRARENSLDKRIQLNKKR
jgi:hypothetical protein